MSTTTEVQHRIDEAGERFWRYCDFSDLPPLAVAQALSRLTREGALQRLSKGLYYRSRPTRLGPSRPNRSKLQYLAAEKSPLFPAGIAAAARLGFTTQVACRSEVSTTASSLPRKLIGNEMLVHPGRPAAWSRLTDEQGALLEFLRDRARWSELSPQQTVQRLLERCARRGWMKMLLEVAPSEPPRVRALLGAIGQQLESPPKLLEGLRASLNPLSRFDFGILRELKHADQWQARLNKP